MFVEPQNLVGQCARLEPLGIEHQAALNLAAADGKLWTLWYTSVPAPAEASADMAMRLAARGAGTMMPYVVRRMVDGVVVGATTFCNIEVQHRRLEIGNTWYARSAQRTEINTEVKLLMLTHAFETLQCRAVEFRTHWMNHDSRAAIERLGAKLDGVLRAHRIGRQGEIATPAFIRLLRVSGLACEHI